MINSCSCCHLQNKSAPHSPINTLYLSCLTLFHFMQWILLDLANSMLIQTLIHINRIIILVSIIHDPFSCHNSSMPYLQRGREGWGKENEKKIRRKLLNVKASPFSPTTSPLSLSIIQLSLQIFAMWFFSMAFGYGIKQVNWWFLPVNATPESLKCIDAVPARSLIHHTNHQWIGTTAHRQYKRNFAYIQFFGYGSKASKCFTTIISTNSWLMNSSQVNSKATSNCNTTCSMSNFLQNQSCTCYVGLCDSM